MYTRKIPYICIGYIFPIFGEYMSLIGTFREHMSAKLIYLPGAQLSGAQLSRGPTVRGPTVRLEKVDSWAPDSWAPRQLGPGQLGPG